MICKNCGKEILDNYIVCPHCKEVLNEKEFHKELRQEVEREYEKNKYNISKKLEGVMLALFLGVIGFIVGIAIYPERTIARETFLKAWVITFCISIAIGVISGLIVYIVYINAIISMLH